MRLCFAVLLFKSQYYRCKENAQNLQFFFDDHVLIGLFLLQELESERKKQLPALDKVKELGKKLSDNTKDGNTKFEIKSKIASIEKPMLEAEKKLQARSNEVSKLSEQGDKLRASCQDLVALLGELKDKQERSEPISGDPDVLKKQSQQNRVKI